MPSVSAKDTGTTSIVPHNVPFVLLGSGLLWFGWFGFNAGSALGASPIAGLAFVTTMLAPAATLVVWTLLDAMRSGKPTAVGAATAIVVGLVAVTPAAGFVSPLNALILGGIAAVPSYFAIQLRAKTSFDDSLDVIAAHGVGGTVGALLTGVFADKSLNTIADGALYGNPGQLLIQGTAVLAAIVYSGVASFMLLKLIGLVIPLTRRPPNRSKGIDISAHGEEAYMHASGAAMVEAAASGAPNSRRSSRLAVRSDAVRQRMDSLSTTGGTRAVPPLTINRGGMDALDVWSTEERTRHGGGVHD